MSNAKTKRRAAAQPTPARLWLWAGLAAVAILAIAGFFFWQSGGGAAAGLPREISIADALARREAGAFMLDVRQPEEWNEYHMPGSTLIPLGELAGRVSELPRDQEIVVVCRSGNRSQQGRDILLQAGFTQVTSMAGGLSQWRAAGYPILTGP